MKTNQVKDRDSLLRQEDLEEISFFTTTTMRSARSRLPFIRQKAQRGFDPFHRQKTKRWISILFIRQKAQRGFDPFHPTENEALGLDCLSPDKKRSAASILSSDRERSAW
jgi:hypothetical protein